MISSGPRDASGEVRPTPDLIGDQLSDQLKGRVALITGAASGLGAATAHLFGAHGAHVILGDLRSAEAERESKALQDAGYVASPLALDVSDPDSARRAIEQVTAEQGRLDILVNAAGVDVTASATDLPPEEWRRVLGVNLDGPFWMSQAALRVMRDQGGGHIVNIASTASKRAWANAAAYHASKWGLLGLSHALHVEGRESGVKVTAIVAGGMRTPFLFDRFPDLDPGLLQDPECVARTILFAVCQPPETVIPELTVLPMRETSWP